MRIKFLKGEQRNFIEKILSSISVEKAAKICHVSERTIRDWRREKFLPNKNAVMKLCEKTKILFPKNIELKDDYWYIAFSSKAGALAVIKKYGRIGGDPVYRKKKWYEWWEREGKYTSKIINPFLPITKPRYSEKLAEFVGFILGDGSIAKNSIELTLHYKDDKDYGIFAKNLIKELFDVPVKEVLEEKYSVNRFLVYRSELVNFCVEKLGLKIGNKIKQQVDIPEWIKKNKKYSIACIRGLMDTDGCIFNHRYTVGNKVYVYKKMSFTSFSGPMRQSFFDILHSLGIKSRFFNNRDIRIDSIKDVKLYFSLIGSHNPKHLNKYYK